MSGVQSVRGFALTLMVGVMSALVSTSVKADIVAPPTLSVIDANGVNLANGKYQLPGLDVGIGASGSGISRVSQEGSDTYSGIQQTQFYPDNPGNPSTTGKFFIHLSHGGTVHRFWVGGGTAGSPIVSANGPFAEYGGGNGKLTCNATGIAILNASAVNCSVDLGEGTVVNYAAGFLQSIIRPDGEVVTPTYYTDGPTIKAIKSVSSSLGWMLKYEVDGSYVVTKVTAINSSVNYCDPNAATCSVNASFPTVSQSTSGNTTTISRNGVAVVSYTVNGSTTTITSPGGPTKTVVFSNAKVSSVSVGGSTWTYSYSTDGSNNTTTTVTAPNGKTRSMVVSSANLILSQTDEANRATTYLYTAAGKLSKVVNPDGNALTGGFTEYEYDGRGNVKFTRVVPKGGATNGVANAGAAMVTEAGYDPNCANPKVCNKPTYVIDPNGVRNDYVYDGTHGGLKHIYGPVINSVQAETRYSYAAFTPYIKNASGGYVAQPQVWRLTQTDACMTLHQNTCFNGTDERRTVITYSGYNVMPTATTLKRGDGSLAQTTTIDYNDNGQVRSAIGPKGGVSNQAFSFYDDLGRVKGAIDIDPDGSGSRLRQATRTSYDSAGRAWKVEAGTVNGTTENDVMNGLTVLTTDTNEFSPTTGLATVARHYEGATLTNLTQKSYDNLFRTDCVAQRLNPAVFGTISSTAACSLGTAGADGPDRLVKYAYDPNSGVLVNSISAYGTPEAASEAVSTYDLGSATSTGTLTSVADAKGNKTSYYYDGFNRLWKTCYAQAANGSQTNTGDCEQMTFRATSVTGVTQAGTLTASVTLRDGQMVGFNYDTAGRVSSKTLAGTVNETFTYNNFNQVLTHTQNNVTGTYAYNSLGWLLSDAQPMGTVGYAYDAYGRRSSLAYPGGFSVVYDYNNDDGVANLYQYQSGLSALIGFTYNNSTGTRDLLWRVNGQHTNYSFGNQAGAAGTNNIGPNLVGIAQGSANSLSFTYNTADQIKARTNSNGSFNHNPSADALSAYVNDGLNRISTINGSGLGYDGRGNLNADGGNSYVYNINNLLTSATQSGVTSTLTYDAENRLLSITKNGATTKFLYDGADLIAEYDGNNTLLRRYAHGPGIDEPLVMYDNVYVNNLGTRYFLHADQQGTITHVTNDNGTLNTVYAYDAYGLRQTVSGSLESRFSYTGQTWLKEIGMYYYKARLYHPAIGRFMQTDPIGYGDGMNMYAYVGNDPVNRVDPWGLYGRSADVGGGCNVNTYRTSSTSTDPKTGEVTVRGFVNYDVSCTIPASINVAGQDYDLSQRYNYTFQIYDPITTDYMKCGGEKGARGPDFAALNVAVGVKKTKLSAGGGVALDRHGALYMGWEFGGNKSSIDGASVTATLNYLVDNGKTLQTTVPNRGTMQNYLTGYGRTVAGGDGLGGAYSFNQSGSSAGGGLAAGASVSLANYGKNPVAQLRPNHCVASR